MFDSLIPLATVLSSGESWFSDATANPQAANTLVTPQEPTTLTLALIGIATVSLYLIATGLRRPRVISAASSDQTSGMPELRRYAKPAEQQPSRGAA